MDSSHKSIGSIIRLKPEFRERYIILHKHTFPAVLDRIRKSNISDYSIFLHEDILFSCMRYSGSDYQADMAEIGKDPVTREWWQLTDPMQEPVNHAMDGEWWKEIELVYEHWEDSFTGITHRSAFHSFPDKLPPLDQLAKGLSVFQSLFEKELKVLKLFHSIGDIFIFLEHDPQLEEGRIQENLKKCLGLTTLSQPLKEVFHTDAAQNPDQQKKVFVTGCFDMLHSGHVAFLQEASEHGDVYVCIGSDANVENLKGRLPVNSQEERKYMIDALNCVKECRINKGWGIIDFEAELDEIAPDIFIVNEDGHTPVKHSICEQKGIEYKVLKRIPHGNLPARSTTALRLECTIPFRIDLAGGWLDQPFVSKFHPGPVITISIEPTLEFNERSGMASSTRRKAIELWRNEIPFGSPEKLARLLFTFENPPGTKEVAGSQDSLGIVMPGLNKLDYDGGYWPEKITSVHEEEILTWLENSLYLVTLGPRVKTYSVIDNTRISKEGAENLARATEDCWLAINNKDIYRFGDAFRRSFESQVAMFPNMVDDDILATIAEYKEKALGWKLSGAGGGGYLILVTDTPIADALRIKIRRKNSF